MSDERINSIHDSISEWGETMTIKKMRGIMKEKVVPEEIVPQNVINLLIDEEAEPPKPDAFAFLMRLRSLGIGSSDFLDLLEGCDAPDDVVARIRENPAMNLQGLILTLDNSELTPDDYTRMLLTARQVWERTLTLRLEKSEKLSRELEEELVPVEPEETDNETEEAEPVTEEVSENTEHDEAEPDEYEPDGYEDDEEYGEEEYDPDYDEDMMEMSFTAVLNKINAEIRDGTFAPGVSAEEAEDDREEYTPEASDKDSGKAPDEGDTFAAAFDKIKHNKEAHDNASDEDIGETSGEEDTFAAAFDKIKHKKAETAPEPRDYETEKPEEPEQTDEEEETDAEDTAPIVRIDKKSARKSAGVLPKPEEDEPEDDFPDDEYDEDEDDDAEYDDDDDEEPHRGYHKGAIIGSAVGAAVLVAAGAVIGATIGGKGAETLRYAKDASDIFDKVYYAYDASTPGGDMVCETSPDLNTVFGDLLIGGSEPANIGLFTQEGTSYSVTETEISTVIVENGAVVTPEKIVPPENARFVAAFDENGALYAVFSGKQSGFMKLSGGKTEFTVLQDGVLTDHDISDGEIRLGTIYTPVFGHTFGIEDESEYLPKTGTGELSPIPAQNVIISDTKGYSYGVSAGYSLTDGKMTEVSAIMGDPVAASADGRFALNGDKGLIVKTLGKSFQTEKIGRLKFAAFGSGICAVIEQNDGEPNTINLFNGELKSAAVLTGVPDNISGMWFEDTVFAVGSGSGSVIRVDCSTPSEPAPLSVRAVRGITSGNSAITLETDDGKLIITRYELENGTAKKLAEYSKFLSAESIATVELGENTAMLLDGAKTGAAYSFFDGVSVISEYVVFAEGGQPKTVSVFDDKTGFTAAYKNNGSINAVCGEGIKVIE